MCTATHRSQRFNACRGHPTVASALLGRCPLPASTTAQPDTNPKPPPTTQPDANPQPRSSPYAPSYRSFWDFAKEKNLDSDAFLRMVLAPRDVAHFVFPDEDMKQMQAKAVVEFENAVNSLADMVERICSDPDAVKEIPVMAANELNSVDANTSASGPFLAVDNGEVVLRAFWNVYFGDDWSKASYRAEKNSFMGDHGWVDWTPFEQVRAVDYEHYCLARMKVSQEVARRAHEAMSVMNIYAPEMFTTSFTAHALADLMNNTTVIDLLDSDNLYNEEDWMP